MHDRKSNPDNRREQALRHPCFDNCDFHNAVIHLPVVSKTNISYKMDLPRECCPEPFRNKTDNLVITPDEAVEYFNGAKKSLPNITVAAISGPGEGLADFDRVKRTFQLMKGICPEIRLCLSTNGLMLPIYANHLISLGVNFMTVTLHTINPETGGRIYDHITYLGHNYYGEEGANILLQNQISGISYMISRGVSVRINIPVLKGINENEMEDMVSLAKEMGCNSTNVIRLKKGGKNDENGLETYSSDELSSLRDRYEKILPQSYYCKPCHSSTIETINTRIFMDSIAEASWKKDKAMRSFHLRFAVCSQNRKLIDQHFGHAKEFFIYDYKDGKIEFVESRTIDKVFFSPGGEIDAGRIYKLIRTIEDCNCVICMRIGICPAQSLKDKNIETYTTYNFIEEGIREAVNRLYFGLPFENRP